jgi:DUF1365 family protein
MRDWLFCGEVLHRRLRPAANAFRYPVFFLRIPLSRLDELPNAVFSVNSFNMLSFHFADHGDGRAPQKWIRDLLASEGVPVPEGEVILQTFPRVLGFVFNPVSFWYCHDAAGALAVVVAEVNNTFGERHCYLLRNPDGAPIRGGQEISAAKVFHVSPFCPVEGGYRFRFHEAHRGGATRVVARIDYHDAQGDLLLTSVSGAAREFSTPGLVVAFVMHPMMTLGVVLRIHYQALKLWLKGAPFFRKPMPPARFVSR